MITFPLGSYEAIVLKKKEFEAELRKKLLEEAQELLDAPQEKILNELADVLELTKSLAAHYDIPFSEVNKLQEKKRSKWGTFKKKLFLIWSTQEAGK